MPHHNNDVFGIYNDIGQVDASNSRQPTGTKPVQAVGARGEVVSAAVILTQVAD